jgi:hypothetical protein
LKSIKIVEGNRLKIDAFSARLSELNDSINKSMEAYRKTYGDVAVLLYPPNDDSKSKEARALRKQQGGKYFTSEEAQEIAKLGSVSQLMMKIVDAEI